MTKTLANDLRPTDSLTNICLAYQ